MIDSLNARNWHKVPAEEQMRPFNLIDTEPRTQVRQIAVQGELDLSNAKELREALDRAAGCSLVLIDLSECEFIDSTGLAIFIHADNAMKEEGRHLALFGVSDQVHRAIEIMGLPQMGLIFDTAEAAEAAAEQKT
jgi:anti-sigma B factor antagonist